jgi:hypothetical protein
MAEVASPRRLGLEYWGRQHPQSLAPASPLDLFPAPILLAAEPAGRSPRRPRRR